MVCKNGPGIESIKNSVDLKNNQEFNNYFTIRKLKNNDYKITPKFKEDLDVFSMIHLEILKDLSDRFNESSPQGIEKEFNQDNDPWYMTYKIQGHPVGTPIPLEIGTNDSELTKSILNLHERLS